MAPCTVPLWPEMPVASPAKNRVFSNGAARIGWASFALLPVFGLLLCALPALDAHTRLLFGRRLEYRVTEKVPVQAHFRDARGAPLPKPMRDPVPLRRTRFDQLPQYRAYAPGSTTAVTDSVLLVYRDLR